jgi:hypothetical protein
MVSFGSHTSQNTFSVEGLPVDVQTCSECLLSVAFNEGIVTMVPAVVVQVFRSGVGMCGVNVSSHKRKGPYDAIAHHTNLKVAKWAHTGFVCAACHSECSHGDCS